MTNKGIADIFLLKINVYPKTISVKNRTFATTYNIQV